MHFLQSTPDPEETSPLCVTFARWFLAHRFSWIGTPAELIAELSTLELIDGNPAFVDSDQLVSFLEANIHALRRLGVVASVTTLGGRLRSISLHVTEPPTTTQTAAGELVPERDATKQEFPVTSHPATAVDEVLAEIARDTHAENTPKLSKSSEPPTLRFSTFAELGDAIGVRKFDAPSGEPEDIPEADERRAKYLPLVAAAIVVLVVLAALFAFSRQKDRVFATSRSEQPPPSNSLLNLPASNRSTTSANGDALDRRLRNRKFNDLLREASETRLPTSQYELATRYAEGIGVKTDKVAACAWLILAHANGSTRADEKLRTISGSLSPLESQKVRIQVGKFYSTGVGVARDNVTAHSWFSLAEVAGSADATVFKKRLEAKMTPEQIDQATTRTTSWLSHH